MTQHSNRHFSEPARRALILFTSHPVKEAQRKHLADRIEQVKQLYRSFLGQILSTAYQARTQVDFDVIIASDAADLPNIEKVHAGFDHGETFTFLEHRGDNFESKFHYALKSVAEMGYRSMVMIGNDCLDLTGETITSAFGKLKQNDMVIGPSADGGFYLIGLNGYREALFQDIPWCSAGVLEQLRHNSDQLGFRSHALPLLQDIDHRRDLLAWLKSSRESAAAHLAKIILAILACSAPAIEPEIPFLKHSLIARRYWQLPPPALTAQ